MLNVCSILKSELVICTTLVSVYIYTVVRGSYRLYHNKTHTDVDTN